MVCRVEAFRKVVQGLDETRRGEVSSMGFGGLLHLNVGTLPRHLCYWLMSRVDSWECCLYGGDNRPLYLKDVHVNCVLGIPVGKEEVPTDIGMEEEEKICQ